MGGGAAQGVEAGDRSANSEQCVLFLGRYDSDGNGTIDESEAASMVVDVLAEWQEITKTITIMLN